MKTKNVTVDSSVLIPLMKTTEIHYEKSKEFFDKMADCGGRFLIPIVVLFEVFHNLKKLHLLDYQLNYRKFKNFFDLDCFQYFNLDLSFFNMFKEFNFFNKLKTSDAIIATAALLTRTPLISWDKKIIESYEKAYTPEEFLKRRMYF
ncbi:PIN domain-containing protein [Candidatus Peregrinibacteria bacterium]|nr:PIN domain-containing protein [Candidatus Peregrinibacteria bacterium]